MPTIHSQHSESSGSGIYIKFPKIAGFTVLEHLHEGSYTSIYRAKQDRLGRIVSLKLLQEWPPPSDVALERFNRAAYVGAQALHPNLVTVHDTGTKDGYHYAIMENIEGQTLQRTLAEISRVDEKTAVNIGLNVCRALVALHARDICHRNVKPKNIFVEKTGKVRLIGVGLASCKAAFFSPHLDAHAIGTPHFMAPEMIRGSCSDPRSDLYSLGVTLYVMIAGHPPFERGIPAVVMSRHLTDSYIPLSTLRTDVSTEFVTLVHALMERDVAKRIQNAVQALAQVEKIAAKIGALNPVPLAPAAANNQGPAPKLARPKVYAAATRSGSAGGPRHPVLVALLSMVATLGVVYGITQGVSWYRGSNKQLPPTPQQLVAPLVVNNRPPEPQALNEQDDFDLLMGSVARYERDPQAGVKACMAYTARYSSAPATRRERVKRLLEYYRGKLQENERQRGAADGQNMEF